MSDARDRAILRLTRYGVPAIMLVFYLSAALRYAYTPESVYAALGPLAGLSPAGGTVSPLWTGLIGAAAALGGDPVTAAKTLSLLLGSGSILLAFLIGVEVLRDRLLAFLAALMVGAQNALLLAAVSGHPQALLLALSLGGLFLLQRNRYTGSALLLGCAGLVTWHALLLLPVLAADAVTNAPVRRTGAGRALAALSTAAGPLCVWAVVASFTESSWLPVMPAAEKTGGIVVALPAGFLLAAAAGGLGVLARGTEEDRRALLALLPAAGGLLAAAAGGALGESAMLLVAAPFLCALGLFGLGTMLFRSGAGRLVTPAVLILAGLIILTNQLELRGALGGAITDATARKAELAAIGAWLRSHAAPDEEISSDRPATLAWYAGRAVSAPGYGSPRLVVLPGSLGAGFAPVYRMPLAPEDPAYPGIGYAVWRLE